MYINLTYSGTMMNPVKQYREQNDLTQLELAHQLGITRQVITNLESGLMLSLPIATAIYMDKNDPVAIQTRYLEWVHLQRLKNSHYFHTPLVSRVLSVHYTRFQGPKGKWFAFKAAVEGYDPSDPSDLHRLITPSNRGFCRRLIFQPSVVIQFEERNQGKPSIVNALQAVGLTNDQIWRLGIRIK